MPSPNSRTRHRTALQAGLSSEEVGTLRHTEGVAAAVFGVGLASSVLLDAFVLRTVLVPALMHLFGSANWWLPGWIDRWLPHLSVEPADEDAAPDLPTRPVHATAP